MARDEVEVEVRGAVQWITLCRPESKNGLTPEVNRKILAGVRGAAERAEVRALVLFGAGGSFSSGLDLRAAFQGGPPADLEGQARELFLGLIRAIRACPKPVVALIDGPATGYGCDIALACDLRVATERARLCEVFVRRGLMPDGGATYMLPRLIGVGRALELLMTGEPVAAEAALELGLVNRLVQSARAAEEVQPLLDALTAGPPLALAKIKNAVYGALASDFDAALDNELSGQLELLRSRDFMEGLTAFFEKRPPVFRGE
jgi:enoyl-CoA hydratase/carnithine racemase